MYTYVYPLKCLEPRYYISFHTHIVKFHDSCLIVHAVSNYLITFFSNAGVEHLATALKPTEVQAQFKKAFIKTMHSYIL